MKPSHRLIRALVSLSLLCSAAAQAQGIWRCGPQGNSFSDRPCAEGMALSKPTPPHAVAVQQAAEVARREAALAQRLRAERQAQEQQFQREQAVLQRNSRLARKEALEAAAQQAVSRTKKRAVPAADQVPLRVAAAPR